MRGRMQAIYVALIGSWLPLLPQATLGLVTLRKGWREGLIVTFAALTPILFGMYWGKVGPSMVLISASVFVAAYTQALVLRWSVSWTITLFFVVASSGLVGVIVTQLNSGLQQEVADFYRGMLENSTGDKVAIAEQMELVLTSFTALKASGLISFGAAIAGLTGLLFARWLQAMLYNPGGFKVEFHALRLTLPLAVFSMIAVLYCGFKGSGYVFWAYLFSLPLVISGLALAHCMNSRFNGGYGVVIAMYAALFFMGELALLVVFFGFSDSFMHYREKFKFKQ